MTEDTLRLPDEFKSLLERPDPAVLVTVGASGFPQATPVWFVADDDVIGLSTLATHQKVKNLRERRECAFLILDLKNPNRYVEIRATAEIVDDAEGAFADRVSGKYATDIRGWDPPGAQRVRVSLRPVRVRTVDAS